MPNPYAPRVARTLDPFPERRLRDVGADDELVAYWRAVAATLPDGGTELYADWRELSDDELARDVLGNVEQLPDPAEASVEWEPIRLDPSVDDVPRNARDVVAWIADARDDAEQQYRAEVSLTVEQQRAAQRVTVLDAVREVIGAS